MLKEEYTSVQPLSTCTSLYIHSYKSAHDKTQKLPANWSTKAAILNHLSTTLSLLDIRLCPAVCLITGMFNVLHEGTLCWWYVLHAA